MAVTRYVWAVYGAVAATGKRPGQPTYDPSCASAFDRIARRGLDSYSDDSELAARIQSRALEAFVVALKKDRKLKLLNFVTFIIYSGD